MKEGLWSIVNGTEQAPGGEDQEKIAKFAARKDRALVLIVLSVEPALLYLLGDPVFGCKAFARVPKDERGKLDSKAKNCILVGYGDETKAYPLYDPLKKRICFSRDVCFKENEHGFEDEVTHLRQQYVELDLWSEDDANPDPVVTDKAPVLPPPEQPPVRQSGKERRFPDYILRSQDLSQQNGALYSGRGIKYSREGLLA